MARYRSASVSDPMPSQRVGLQVVAGCDRDPETRAAAAARLPAVDLTDRWEDLLELDLDGVVLANDFDAHAPLAMEFLERGVHVLSESAACTTEQEGRRLIEAVDRSSATYSLAENYVVHPHVRAIREAVDRGEVGSVELIEADYLHGMSPEMVDALIGDPSHWRGRIAPTAYCTHTLCRAGDHRGATCGGHRIPRERDEPTGRGRHDGPAVHRCAGRDPARVPTG
jgi:predicted dehydrogenase